MHLVHNSVRRAEKIHYISVTKINVNDVKENNLTLVSEPNKVHKYILWA